MHNTQPCKQMKRHTNSKQKFFGQINVIPQTMIEAAMVNHIDAFAFVKLTSHVEQVLIKRLSRTKFIYQPNVFLVINRLLKHTNRLLLLLRWARLNNLVNLHLYIHWRVAFAPCLGELFHRKVLLILFAKPNNSDSPSSPVKTKALTFQATSSSDTLLGICFQMFSARFLLMCIHVFSLGLIHFDFAKQLGRLVQFVSTH